MTSGAIQYGDPTTVFFFWRVFCSLAETPKSAASQSSVLNSLHLCTQFGVSRGTQEDIGSLIWRVRRKGFPSKGITLRSRCRMFLECKKINPFTVSDKMAEISSSVRLLLQSLMMSMQLPPSQYSMTISQRQSKTQTLLSLTKSVESWRGNSESEVESDNKPSCSIQSTSLERGMRVCKRGEEEEE